jgi:hypothetical protein
MITIERQKKLAVILGRALATVGLVTISCALSAAQSSQQSTPPMTSIVQQPSPLTARDRDRDRRDPDMPASFEEMRAKNAIKAVEKEHQENVNRARDLSTLSASMNLSFKQKTYLGKDEIKKLEKAEKLAKAIRSAAGGSEDENEIERPKDLACALTRFAEVAESLKNNVEKTPKHVISTTVIDEANVVLELARIIRTLIPNP